MTRTAASTLVFIHGAAGTHRVWDFIVDGLDGLSVETIDLPGHVPGNGSSFASIASYASALRHALPTGPIVLVGHSMGGLIAIELTSMIDTVVGLVTIGTGTHMAVNSELLDSAKEKPALAMVPIVKWSLRREASDAHKIQLQDSASREAVDSIFDDLTACDAYVDANTRLSKFGRPALIAIGDEDRMVPRSQAETLAAASDFAKLVVIDNAGHTPQITQSEKIVAIVADFAAVVS